MLEQPPVILLCQVQFLESEMRNGDIP
jgi:hypothetical protein